MKSQTRSLIPGRNGSSKSKSRRRGIIAAGTVGALALTVLAIRAVNRRRAAQLAELYSDQHGAQFAGDDLGTASSQGTGSRTELLESARQAVGRTDQHDGQRAGDAKIGASNRHTSASSIGARPAGSGATTGDKSA